MEDLNAQHGRRVSRDTFYIEYPGELNGRLKHTLINHDTHRFKQLKEIDILARKAKDVTIESVYECSHANKTGCPCKFILREDQSGEVIGEHTDDLLHFNDIHSWRMFKAKTLIFKELLHDPFVSPQTIMDRVYASPEFDVDQFTPPIGSMKNALLRIKTKMVGVAQIDKVALANLFSSTRTRSGDAFLLFDGTHPTRDGERKRVVGFSSGFMLDVAQRGRGVFLGDGTFDSVPTMFKQLYTIHAEVDGSVFPVVFVLMEERSTEAYECVFNALKERGLVFKTFMTDFESASRNAARNVFGDVVVKGCWFHFTQAIMRRAKKIGLEGAYRTSAFVNATIRRLFGLPFVARDDVEAALCAVENTLVLCPDDGVRQKLLELMRYFRATWMGKYKPHEWSQFNDVVLRSNNWSEAFHAALSRRFVRAHPNVRVVVEALKNVEAQTRVAWNEFRCSPMIRKGNKDSFTRELRQILKKKESRWAGDHLGFLDAVSKIPVLLILRLEKKQLEFWLENVHGQGDALDATERRLSEVDSLLETRSESLVKTLDATERDVDATLSVITRRRLETRKRRLLEKIRQKRDGVDGQRETPPATEQMVLCDGDTDRENDRPGGRAVSPITRGDEPAMLISSAEADAAKEMGAVTPVRRPSVRRRKSVVAKMNDAIRRRRRR